MRLIQLFAAILYFIAFGPSVFAQDYTILEHGTGIAALEFSPVDNALVASAAWGTETIKFWNLQNETVMTLHGHTENVLSIAFSPDGQLLASGSNDYTFKLWRVGQQSPYVSLETDEHPPFRGRRTPAAVLFSPDRQSRILATSVSNSVILWNVDQLTKITTLLFEDLVYRKIFSPNGRYLAVEYGDLHPRPLKIWDVQNQQFIFQDVTAGAFTFSPDSQTFVNQSVFFSPLSQLEFLSVSDWKVYHTIHTGGSIYEVAFSPDGKIIASVGYKERSALWSVETGEKLADLRIGHTDDNVYEVAFSPDGTRIVTGAVDGKIIAQNVPDLLRAERAEDVNGDGAVNIQDLVLVASNLGKSVPEEGHPADVNADGQINIIDLVKVAGALGTGTSAPTILMHDKEFDLTKAEVQQWLTQAQQLNLTDPTSLQSIRLLEQLLAAITPKETALLPNYPNPFNPETWIPYQLAEPAKVTVTLYDIKGHVVRNLDLGHQRAGIYQTRTRAAHWDGRNAVGEPVASGVYFYTLTAGDFTATRKMLIRK